MGNEADDERASAFLDANILIRGVTLPRFPYEVLRHASRGDFAPMLSPLVIDSARLYVQILFPDYVASLEAFLASLRFRLITDPSAEQVAAHPHLIRDPKDVPVALAAINGGAEYFVSADRDFIDIDASTAELRRHLAPLSPGAFLRRVMGWTSDDLARVERRRWPEVEPPSWQRGT